MLSHQQIVSLLAKMPENEKKYEFLRFLHQRGDLTDKDLDQCLAEVVENKSSLFAEQINKNDLLRFIWERFEAFPEALAHAIVRVCPEFFYGDVEWMTRLVLKLQADMKLRANLGVVTVRPLNTNRTDSGAKVVIDPEIIKGIPTEVLDLDVDCRIRELLYWFSRDVDLGHDFVREERAAANNDYERKVWQIAHERIEALLTTTYPDTIETINSRMFPALHVRWWLARSKDESRVLNIGDTGTYKTSYAALDVLQAGCQQTLVFCAPGARDNWENELKIYFPWARRPGVVHVIRGIRDVAFIPRNARFIVVGYSNLTRPEIVSALSKLAFDGVIWDECQYGKNVLGKSAAQRALACLTIIKGAEARLKKVLALSVTPWENSPVECAALATILRPDLFPDPERFVSSGVFASPRLLRAIFGTCILDIELQEVRDLPTINPQPWEDLFGPVPLEMNPDHAELYRFVQDHEPDLEQENGNGNGIGIDASAKVRHLLHAADMPHVLTGNTAYDWPDEMAERFSDWRLSTKLVWLKRQLDECLHNHKVVVATGVYVQGVTQPYKGDDDGVWVGKLLKEWYGDEAVLLLDGSVGVGSHARDSLIARWRTDPRARILLVSMKTCPDSINLSVLVRNDPTVQGVKVIAYAQGWLPWKQFLGRFWREGLTVPVEYLSLVLVGDDNIVDTADESRYELVKRKWEHLVRFRARVPPTEEEWNEYTTPNSTRLKRLTRSPTDHVNLIASDMRGAGEDGVIRRLSTEFGIRTNAEIFARSFVQVQDFGASGHIARFMTRSLTSGLIPAGILDRPELIFDAGCGPLTMERYLDQPIYGIDINPTIVDLGRTLSPHQGTNAEVGRLSQLPSDWTDRFRLTVSSLAIDWTNLEADQQEPERIRILRELVRVTESYGLIWLTFNRQALDETLYECWVSALRSEGCDVLPLSGLIVPKGEGHKTKPKFAFWSILFSLNGNKPRFTDHEAFRFTFELARNINVRNGKGKGPEPGNQSTVVYNDFEVVNPLASRSGTVLDNEAVKRTILREFQRWGARPDTGPLTPDQAALDLFAHDWRTLQKLASRGAIALTT